MKKSFWIILVLALLVAIGGFYGYKRYQAKKANPLAGSTVKIDGMDVQYGSDGKSATITDPKTGAKLMAGTDLKLPNEFPKDIPIYNNGKITVVSLDPKAPLLSMSTPDAVKSVQDWYQADLQKKGWKVTANNVLGPEAANIEFENTDNVGSMLIAKDDEDKTTTITLSTMTRAEAEAQRSKPQ